MEIVGWSAMSDYKPNWAPPVLDVFVAPPFRKLGRGKVLFQKALQDAEVESYLVMFQPPALGLLKNCNQEQDSLYLPAPGADIVNEPFPFIKRRKEHLAL